MEINKEINYKKLTRNRVEGYERKWKRFFDELDDDVQEAILIYTHRNKDITRKLLGANHIKEIYFKNIDDIIENLDKAMLKFNFIDDIIVYRGTSKEYFKDVKVGDILTPGYYFSTSVDEWYAKRFIYHNKENRKNPLFIKINVPSGSKAIYVGHNSGFTYNKELILSRDTKYKVLSVGKDKIELEVIK